jgi:hypothetical protein
VTPGSSFNALATPRMHARQQIRAFTSCAVLHKNTAGPPSDDRSHYPDVLSHPNRGMSRGSEASTVLSHRDEATRAADLIGVSRDSINGLRTCLMIGETTDGADCLTYLRHRR